MVPLFRPMVVVLDSKVRRCYQLFMAKLKYYMTERKSLPREILEGTIPEKDISVRLRQACRHFGVVAIKWELWGKRYSCYNLGDEYGTPPDLQFSHRKYISRGVEVSFIGVHHFLHEFAHYLDDCQRARDIESLPTNDIHAYVRRSIKIRQAKWHGPRHRAKMVLLVKWWTTQTRRRQ
jgi:hypothetical protein